ncbi:glucosyltransferase domain-containing protein [Lacticaseibacillus paracasei]|nr:glucosyltransferase domain-containing protein [Lacticaseibacillus paracasei]
MINESQKFLNFLKKKRKAVSFLFAVTLLLYLPMLTNFSYSIDSEAVVDNSKDLLFSWLTIDRFGLVALKKFFLFGLDLNPYFINTLTYLLMAFSAVILLYIIDQLIQTTPWIPLLAVTLYLVSPIHFEQNSFVLQSVEVMIGFNLMFVGMIALGMPGNKVSPKRLIFGMLFLTASFSIYPSIVIGASTLAIIILHLHELNKPFATFSVYFRHLVRYIALT